jgi:hypothetical protein
MTGHTKAFAPGNTKIIGPGILDLAAALAAAPVPTTGVGDGPRAAGPRLQLRLSPNPARAGSDFTLATRAGQRVELRIVDASGRAVRALAGVADGSGAYRLRWDGRGADGHPLHAGLYFVTASAGAERVTGKLVVLD